jgi:hypothetical protein
MNEGHAGKLRIHADFTSCMEDERGSWCWLLRHDGKLLDDVAASLALRDGLSVTLYHDHAAERFEVDAVLGHIAKPDWTTIWMALPDWNTYRRLK